MSCAPPARTIYRTRIRWGRVAALLLAVVATVALLAGHVVAGVSSTLAPEPPAGALGEAGGALPKQTTVFDTGVPGVARLDRDLREALQRAARDAPGVRFTVSSGWRSAAYQRRLLREAVATYGSEAEASRWVASPATSAHVKGDAVDLAPDAAGWVSAHGAAYGLCRIYANEAWHFELRPDAVADGCPAMYADAAHDPTLTRRGG